MKHLGPALALLLVMVAPADATVYWEEGYENHLYTGSTLESQLEWQVDSACASTQPPLGPQDGCNAHITTTQPRTGTHSLQSDFGSPGCPPPAPNPGCGSFMDRYFAPHTPDFWQRFWMRQNGMLYSSKVTYAFGQGTGNAEFTSFTGGNGQDQPNAAGQGEVWAALVTRNESGFTGHPCPSGPHPGVSEATCYYWRNENIVKLTDNTWHCIEIHLKLDSVAGAGDGLLEMYVNGLRTLNYPNVHVRDASSDDGYKMVRHFTQYGSGTRWVDDWAVGNARIGCGGALPPTPNAPTNFNLTYWLGRLWAWLLTPGVAWAGR